MDFEESRIEEPDKEIVAPRQQWRLKPSPTKQGDSFSLDDSLESKDDSTSFDLQSITPRKVGILRVPDTPGTGQSVRFGKRIYDDGDESRMSNSTANISDAATTSPRQVAEPQEQSEDSVDMSLGFIRSSRRHTLADPGEDSSEFSREEEEVAEQEQRDNPTLRSVLALGGSSEHDARFEETFALPNLEGYSNLDDISLDFGDRTGEDRRMGDSTEADLSFNESFLQAEMEMAKRHMEEENDRRKPASIERSEGEASEQEKPISSESTVKVTNEELNEEQSKGSGTPHGANSTQASEYMSTRSQTSSKSPASSAPDWMTPTSHRTSPGSQGSALKAAAEADMTSEIDESSSSSMPRPSDDSPSVQRVNRRVSLHGAGMTPSISLARLQSLTNLPSKRSPLGEASNNLPSPGGSSSSVSTSEAESRGQASNERQDESSHSSLTSLQLSSNTIDSGEILRNAIQGASELDSIHMERADKLILWAREAEEQSRIDRCLLVEERARAERAQKEAEMANISLQVMREEEEKVQERRKEKVQGLEELVARLYRQLDEQLKNDTQESKEASISLDDSRILELETRLNLQEEELSELRSTMAQKETECDALKAEQQDWLQEKRELEGSLEKLHEDWEKRTEEKENAYRALESEFDSWREKQYQPDEAIEEERKLLSKKLQVLQEEQQALTTSLTKAQEEVAALRAEDSSLKSKLAEASREVDTVRRELEERTSKCETLERTATEQERDAQTDRQEQQKVIEEREKEVESLQRKVEQMEEENDSLLQSMAELEDYRRTMEEDFLAKRDTALQESKEREEGAISLAEEMQSRLEKLEDKMEKMTTRTTMLEREVGDRGLQISKLEKAKERLEEDNLNYSIALSSKQQELNLLKRNGGRSVRNTPASVSGSAVKTAGSSSRRLSALALRTPTVTFASSRGPLSEMQAADESGSSLPPLQSGPVNLKTMRRKTMDVDTSTPRQHARAATARVDSKLAHNSAVMPPPTTTDIRSSRVSVPRQRSPEEDTKVNGPPSLSSSSTSSVQTSDTAVSAPSASSLGDKGRVTSSRRSSTSSNRTIQAKAALSASIVASEGPMDISELQVNSHQGARMRRRLESREFEAPRLAPTPPPATAPAPRPVTAGGAVTSERVPA